MELIDPLSNDNQFRLVLDGILMHKQDNNFWYHLFGIQEHDAY